MIDISLLGSGGGIPLANRFLSSLIINYKGRKILLDCGEGTQVAMRKAHSGFKTIDIICISHIHGDHIFGLPGLLATIANSDRKEDITIIGPKGINKTIKAIKTLVSYLPFDLNTIEISKGDLTFVISDKTLVLKEEDDKYNDLKKDLEISTIELDHSSPCIGYSFYIPRKPKFDQKKALSNNVPRDHWASLQMGEVLLYEDKLYEPYMVLGEVRRGIKLTYITDTRPIGTIVEFIDGSDLFICEGTYGDNDDLDKAIANKHMTFSEAAMLAKEGDVKKLLLTHFSSAMDKPHMYEMNAKDIFADTIIGYDGFFMSLSFDRE